MASKIGRYLIPVVIISLVAGLGWQSYQAYVWKKTAVILSAYIQPLNQYAAGVTQELDWCQQMLSNAQDLYERSF